MLGAIRAPLGGAGDDVTLKQRVTALEEENVELRRQLERIGKASNQKSEKIHIHVHLCVSLKMWMYSHM